MRVWIVSPYGPVPSEGWRDHRYTSLGRVLASRGHKVIWWTASFAHQFKTQRRVSDNRLEVVPGFEIRFIPTPSYSSNVGLGRLWFEAVFGWRMWHAARSFDRGSHNRPDWILAGEPPKSGGLAARRIARLTGARYAADVYDVWPELWISMAPAMLRSAVKVATLPLVALRRSLLRDADLTFAVNETYAEVARRSGASRVEVVYIGVDAATLSTAPSVRPEAHAVYAGSLGVNYDIPTLLHAAEFLSALAPHFRISVAGDGPLAGAVREAAARLPNLRFLGRLDSAALSKLYATASVGLATYGAASTVALPIKLYDYLAAGLPIVSSLRGEMEDILATHGVGVTYEAGNPQSLAAAILATASSNEQRGASALRARKLAGDFSVERQYSRLTEILEELRD